ETKIASGLFFSKFQERLEALGMTFEVLNSAGNKMEIVNSNFLNSDTAVSLRKPSGVKLDHGDTRLRIAYLQLIGQGLLTVEQSGIVDSTAFLTQQAVTKTTLRNKSVRPLLVSAFDQLKDQAVSFWTTSTANSKTSTAYWEQIQNKYKAKSAYVRRSWPLTKDDGTTHQGFEYDILVELQDVTMKEIAVLKSSLQQLGVKQKFKELITTTFAAATTPSAMTITFEQDTNSVLQVKQKSHTEFTIQLAIGPKSKFACPALTSAKGMIDKNAWKGFDQLKVYYDVDKDEVVQTPQFNAAQDLPAGCTLQEIIDTCGKYKKGKIHERWPEWGNNPPEYDNGEGLAKTAFWGFAEKGTIKTLEWEGQNTGEGKVRILFGNCAPPMCNRGNNGIDSRNWSSASLSPHRGGTKGWTSYQHVAGGQLTWGPSNSVANPRIYDFPHHRFSKEHEYGNLRLQLRSNREATQRDSQIAVLIIYHFEYDTRDQTYGGCKGSPGWSDVDSQKTALMSMMKKSTVDGLESMFGGNVPQLSDTYANDVEIGAGHSEDLKFDLMLSELPSIGLLTSAQSSAYPYELITLSFAMPVVDDQIQGVFEPEQYGGSNVDTSLRTKFIQTINSKTMAYKDATDPWKGNLDYLKLAPNSFDGLTATEFRFFESELKIDALPADKSAYVYLEKDNGMENAIVNTLYPLSTSTTPAETTFTYDIGASDIGVCPVVDVETAASTAGGSTTSVSNIPLILSLANMRDSYQNGVQVPERKELQLVKAFTEQLTSVRKARFEKQLKTFER
ncbi:unnamed protein product, partial [Amoebophrya sp. A120]